VTKDFVALKACQGQVKAITNYAAAWDPTVLGAPKRQFVFQTFCTTCFIFKLLPVYVK
jgi:hypothetical protein